MISSRPDDCTVMVTGKIVGDSGEGQDPDRCKDSFGRVGGIQTFIGTWAATVGVSAGASFERGIVQIFMFAGSFFPIHL